MCFILLDYNLLYCGFSPRSIPHNLSPGGALCKLRRCHKMYYHQCACSKEFWKENETKLSLHNIANISLVELVSGRFSRNVRIFFFTIILARGLKLQRKIKANQNTPTNCMIQTTQLVFFNRIAENLWKTLGKFLLVILSSVLAGKLLIII